MRRLSFRLADKGCPIPWSSTGQGGEEAISNPEVLERVAVTVLILRDNPLRVHQRDLLADQDSSPTLWSTLCSDTRP